MRRSRPIRAAWLSSLAVFSLQPALAAPAEPVAAPSDRFEAPAEPMMLARILRRPLPDGNEVVSRRLYEIRFVADSEGYRVEGALVDVTVDAPPALAMLADLERRRPDQGLFPMRLDADGRIASGGLPRDGETIDQAVDIVAAQLEALRLTTHERVQAEAFAGLLRQRPGFAYWPVDLFRPAPGRRQAERTIPLPNGGRGAVRVDIDAQASGASGLLSSLRRTLTTELEGDVRTSVEIWSLVPKTRR